MVLARLFKIPVTHYFDDFPIVVPAQLASDTQDVTLAVFELLGWRVKTAGEKAAPFSKLLGTLGVVFDLTPAVQGEVDVKNKVERVSELLADVREVLRSQRLTPAHAASLRSRLL